MCILDDISASVELMDFSTDNYYLIYKDSFLKVTIIDLSNMQQVIQNNLEFDIEWCSDGIKVQNEANSIF